MRRSARRDLRALAAQAGVLTSWVDASGRSRSTSGESLRAVLAALGYEAENDGVLVEQLAGERADLDSRLLPSTVVVAAGRSRTLSVPLSRHAYQRLTKAAGPPELRIRSEAGVEWAIRDVRLERREAGPRLKVRLGQALPMGYHEVQLLDLPHAAAEPSLLLVAPSQAHRPRGSMDPAHAFGIAASLYSLRTSVDRGIGDFSALRDLADWCVEEGGDFVGVSPLHALENRGGRCSPYSPTSRFFLNSIFIDVADVPEADADGLHLPLAPANAAHGARIDYDAARDAFLAVMRELFARFRSRADPVRLREFASFREAGGPWLQDFATHQTIVQRRIAAGHMESALDWRLWPSALRTPDGPGIRAIADEHAQDVDFQCFLQFEADRQLTALQRRMRARGASIGLYGDLALGSDPGGFDSWRFGAVLASGAALGAPPDDYAPEGQIWGLPPVSPRALRASRYSYWRSLLRAALKYVGMLRIDHVMGLWRQFWIPSGMSAAQGAYVRQDSEVLLAILRLESVRAGAVIAGEDLGTVPPEVRPELRRSGILRSSVLYFERTRTARFVPPNRYDALAIASAGTHDLPTLADWWEAGDLARLHDLGVIDGAALGMRLEERMRERKALGRLVGLTESTDAASLVRAVHGQLCTSRAVAVSLALDDVALEREPVNVPGLVAGQFAAWHRRMNATIAEIRELVRHPLFEGRADRKSD